MTCKDLEDNILLYLYGELAGEQRAAFEAHLTGCERCRASLVESRRLHQLLGERPVREPSADLVLRSRLALDDALDREQLGWRGLLRAWSLGPRTFPAARRLPCWHCWFLDLASVGHCVPFPHGLALQPLSITPPRWETRIWTV